MWCLDHGRSADRSRLEAPGLGPSLHLGSRAHPGWVIIGIGMGIGLGIGVLLLCGLGLIILNRECGHTSSSTDAPGSDSNASGSKSISRVRVTRTVSRPP